jgi:predicted lipoprotein with Yx(FWY)xxD motif
MKRVPILALVFGVLAVGGLAATAVSMAAATAHSARLTTIQLRSTSLGAILTTAGGRTVYMFTRDGRNRDRCAAVAGCTGVWPLVASSSRPAAGRGVSGRLLGVIRVQGRRQVTYGGWPLYTYTGDSSPAQTSYVGVSQFGGRWYALNARGALVK